MKSRMLVWMVVFCVIGGGLRGMEGGGPRVKGKSVEELSKRFEARRPRGVAQKRTRRTELDLPSLYEVKRLSELELPELPSPLSDPDPQERPERLAAGYTMLQREQPGQLTMIFNTILGYVQINPTKANKEGIGRRDILLQLLPLEGSETLNLSDELKMRNEKVKSGLVTLGYTGYLGRLNELSKLLNGLENTAAIMIEEGDEEKTDTFFADKRDTEDSKIALVNATMAKKMLNVRSENLARMVSYCDFRQNDSVSIFTKVASYLGSISSLLDVRDTVNQYSLSEKVPFEYSLSCAISLYRLLVITLVIIQKVNADFGGVKGVRAKAKVPFARGSKAVEYDVWNALVGLRGVGIIRDMSVLIGGFIEKDLWKTRIDGKKLTEDQMNIFLNLKKKLSEINGKIATESEIANEKWKELTVQAGRPRGRSR